MTRKLNRVLTEILNRISFRILIFAVSLSVSVVSFSSCRTQSKTDMRSLAPVETLVYLETGDLGETLGALTENQAWKSGAAGKPDFSQLKNIQVAVAVTGFETSEKQLTNESSILNFKPHFVLIGDTHAWKPTAVSIVENQIGKFARETYGDDVKLEISEKRDAKFFVWTSADGRKLFSAVSKSLIYVGNDETAIDKCLDVQRGEAENLLKNENLARARERAGDEKWLSFGYISPEGVAQISNLAGVSVAVESSETDIVRSFIAKILPGVLQKTVKEVIWTARKSGEAIEDRITVKTDTESSTVLKETLKPVSTGNQSSIAEFLPLQFNSITRYNLQNPQVAWRSLLLVTSKQMDAPSAKLFAQVSNSFFEPYGISEGETFLSAVGTEIVTARFDEEGEKSVVIAGVKDLEKIKKAISGEINLKAKPEKFGAIDFWKSEDSDLAAAFVDNLVILGERQSVLNCLGAKESGKNFAKTIQYQSLVKDSSAAAATITLDAESSQQIIEVLGKAKAEKDSYTSFYTTVTRFNETGFERKTVSDFGLIGTIVEQFNEGN
jgi:hypothetical protein